MKSDKKYANVLDEDEQKYVNALPMPSINFVVEKYDFYSYFNFFYIFIN